MSPVNDKEKMFSALLEVGTLCPAMQFVVLHRGYFGYCGHVPFIEDWAELSAVRINISTVPERKILMPKQME